MLQIDGITLPPHRLTIVVEEHCQHADILGAGPCLHDQHFMSCGILGNHKRICLLWQIWTLRVIAAVHVGVGVASNDHVNIRSALFCNLPININSSMRKDYDHIDSSMLQLFSVVSDGLCFIQEIQLASF